MIAAHELAEFKRREPACGRQSHVGPRTWCKEVPSRWYWWKKEHSPLDHLRAKVAKGKRGSRTSPESFYKRRFRANPPLPQPLRKLHGAVEASRGFLEWKDDWDGEGSPAYSEPTLNRAKRFLLDNAQHLWRLRNRSFDVPTIAPGPDGSIDLHWRTPNRELLINVPANPEEGISYYGDDKEEGTQNAIRGKKLDISAGAEWIFLWLIK